MDHSVYINFPGGIISPGRLQQILGAATKAKIRYVRFGLRQQLMVDLASYHLKTFTDELNLLQIAHEVDRQDFPNIMSSYPAEAIFIRNTWLTEGVYKDIFDGINFKPGVKVNICDHQQGFTPMLTGNINWIASLQSAHYWHLVVRFPKTNVIYEWDQLCYTNDVAALTEEIADRIKANSNDFIDNEQANGAALFEQIDVARFILKPAVESFKMSSFDLPYYEGINRYDNKYWLGIYRRDELFEVEFLKQICLLCLATKLGQFCCTPWKTIIIKGINEEDKGSWNVLLEKFQLNMRHAANELNFQVEDHCIEGLELKNYLVKQLNVNDTRTFGVCFGIKTRKKSEIFSNILIRKRYLIQFLGVKLWAVYDILCSKDFNPNERTGFVYSSGNPKWLLPEQLRRAVMLFYRFREDGLKQKDVAPLAFAEKSNVSESDFLYQCADCFTVYDPLLGDVTQNIAIPTSFENLPSEYCCSLCESDKGSFLRVTRSSLQVL